MTTLEDVRAWLEERLPELIARYDVPAAGVAVLAGGEVADVATGVLSTATGVAATTDSLFQIGSITKVWTATLAMQLVDEGRLELDAPVRRYLPGLRVADDDAAAAMTVRQLLCHTAGVEGDVFIDTGRGDDCLEKYVGSLSDVPQLFGPGELFSYSNTGYCLLGRLVEVLRDRPYDTCLQDHLFTPLGLTHAAASPYEAILFRTAVGHLAQAGADQQPAPVWAMARSNAAAGGMLAMRPRDLLAFGRMHLDGGRAADGTPVLSSGALRAMQEEQVRVPDIGVMGDAWGLGWELFDTLGSAVIGHDGNTIGQASFLRLVPGHGIGVVLLTNGGNPYGLYRDVVGHVLRELAGIDLRPLPSPPPDPPRIDAGRYTGRYTSRVADLDVSQDGDGRIWAEVHPKDLLAELGGETERSELVVLAEDVLIPLEARSGLHVPYAFLGDDGAGHSRYVHMGRAMPRGAP